MIILGVYFFLFIEVHSNEVWSITLKNVKDYYVKGAMSSFLGTISYLYSVLFF